MCVCVSLIISDQALRDIIMSRQCIQIQKFLISKDSQI